MIAFHLPLNAAASNLAFEEVLFRSLVPDHPGYALFWRNAPSVIVGRHQNTVAEVSGAFLAEHGITAVRRITGGGAVYHDGGNLNYSFLLPHTGTGRPAPINAGALLAPLVAGLASLGIRGECSGRNDVTVDGRKISGTAQFRSTCGTLFHGAMLVDVDMDMLAASLAGAPDKYTSKALPSVRSRVCNVAELLPESDRPRAMELVTQALALAWGLAFTEPDPALIRAAQELAAAKYATWDWTYGTSPAFTERRRRRFPWGALECCFDVTEGTIASCRMYGDFFAGRDIAELEQSLVGRSRNPDAVVAALRLLPLKDFFLGCEPEETAAFIAAL